LKEFDEQQVDDDDDDEQNPMGFLSLSEGIQRTSAVAPPSVASLGSLGAMKAVEESLLLSFSSWRHTDNAYSSEHSSERCWKIVRK